MAARAEPPQLLGMRLFSLTRYRSSAGTKKRTFHGTYGYNGKERIFYSKQSRAARLKADSFYYPPIRRLRVTTVTGRMRNKIDVLSLSGSNHDLSSSLHIRTRSSTLSPAPAPTPAPAPRGKGLRDRHLLLLDELVIGGGDRHDSILISRLRTNPLPTRPESLTTSIPFCARDRFSYHTKRTNICSPSATLATKHDTADTANQQSDQTT